MKDNVEKPIKRQAAFRDLTDEEYARLDKKWTETTPKVGPNGSGFIAKRKAAQKEAHLIAIDGLSYEYLFVKAIADHKTPAEVISDMIQERIAAFV